MNIAKGMMEMAIFFMIVAFGLLAILVLGVFKLAFKLLGFVIDQLLGYIFVKKDQRKLKKYGHY
ncbi:hypothetical protein HCA55_17155 [Listeria booriae]|uniref:Uncharacterized protein n=1 Tax=Listeria booriae TaxID=1552123 RepID=A0A7X1A9E0_9LIST|nr:hypothetical protein [Listeria booriae]MBC1567228.1 hypothetical protein [Listeria booriae]MBC1798470.1 hypothetical protein [Listeria booriae]MBC2174815.1 hypothetical protein [Listeria booriae]MBC2373709.1 hypothetical protein [Listeria booriae]